MEKFQLFPETPLINRPRIDIEEDYAQYQSRVDLSSLYSSIIKSLSNKYVFIDSDENNEVTKITIKAEKQK